MVISSPIKSVIDIQFDMDLFLMNYLLFIVRFEETNMLTLECKADSNNACIGGYARIVTTVKRLQQSRSNAIYLNAGDNFAGTIWFSFGRWNVTKYFLNLLKADALVNTNIILMKPFLFYRKKRIDFYRQSAIMSLTMDPSSLCHFWILFNPQFY